MWEALEAFFYYIRFRKKTLPAPIGVFLIGLVVMLSYCVMKSSYTPTSAPIREIQVEKAPQEKATENSAPAIIHIEKNEALPISDSKDSYSYFKDFLQDRFQSEGIDLDLAQQLVTHIRLDRPVSGDRNGYDLRIPIRNVFKDATDQEIEKMRTLVLEVSRESFKAYSGLANESE